MRIRWTLNPKQSFLETVGIVIPSLYDQFLSRAGTVVRHPRLTQELHRMRIDGKPLRYLMELFEGRFDFSFDECFKEIKNLIELMGKIHDCDVMIPMLQGHLQEMRFYNKTIKKNEEKIPTGGIRELLGRQRKERTILFAQMCATLDAWRSKRFREQLVQSMKLFDPQPHHEQRQETTTYADLYSTTRAGG